MKTQIVYIKNLFALFLITLSCSAFAQKGIVKGTVKDKEAMTPIEDIVVSIESINVHTHTDEHGSFAFFSVPAGQYEVSFSNLGYENKRLTVVVTDNQITEADVLLKSVAKNLSGIDVSADRPVSAASSGYLSQVDFENRPKNSAQDMLRLVPGLFIAQHAGGGKAEQIFIRGFDCDHGTDVATFVDGIPVNMPSHGHGQGYADLHFLIPETVKGMEIFKGPYSPRFGNFATGAAVKFNTLDSLENNMVQVESGYTPNTKDVTSNRALALLKIPNLSSNINSYFAADIINNRGYFDLSQHFKRFNLFSKTTMAITDHSTLSFSASGFGSSWDASGQIPERAVKAGIVSRFGGIDNSEGGTTQRNNLNLIYRTRVGSEEFETQVYSSSYRFKLFSNFTLFLDDTINGDEIEQGDNRTIQGFNAHYSTGHKLGSMNNKFTVGASFRSDNIENQLWHTIDRSRLETRAHGLVHERATGIYANEVFRFSDHFRIETGARFDYFIFDVDDLLPSDSTHSNYSGFNYQTLVSPKLNIIYSPTEKFQLFLNAGSGFHSNDSRSAVQQPKQHQLPRAPGAEVGSLIKFSKQLVASAAVWWLDLENELVYVGDDGTTENKGASRRIGIDFSVRCQLASWLFADADLNISKNRFIDKMYGSELLADSYIPLAPTLTSSGGLTMKFKKIESGIRYRYLADRPANESNSVVAYGYNVVDINAVYKAKKYKVSIVIENLLNTEWNEAQFDTESRLLNEAEPVSELHFTPGTPFSAKLIITYLF